ncbi:NAD(P)-dependent oxidoreductase [Notoacmeibacter sp. MSK16QG-6]|uniref:NAD(P)-dependent oxidoreductase n=1 Tax=Notoacmeibacter sp. MSK16QG-6 TaxID=2957982 RepID=UPI0020A1C1A0|nr:NAD(P)-dependent oxidoreductase [Notoacmeibacter sp. MSK16QG-6]MCP1199488.1 NAD(P)-dependent oxidoreductase [Notoacmeibacter sp. MSK16QG-6]
MARTAFIGLGVMGFPMAGHLKQKGGHDVTVYNRTANKADEWVETYGGSRADTPAEAARDADFVFTCVGNDDDVRSVVFGDDGVLSAMSDGAILIDNTTASAMLAKEIGKAAEEKGVGFIDAPVSGGQAGAENGVLTVMCGGDEATFATAKPVIESYAKMVGLLGPTGSGQLAKMCNQTAIAGLVQGLSEAIHLAKKSGLDVEKLIEVISQGAAGSWQMENRYATMNRGEFDHGFAVDWMRKDLAIVLQQADEIGASLPVTALVDQFYKDVQRMGGKRWDTSSLIARLESFDQE